MQYINVLRVIATFMVVVIHTCSVGEANISANEEYAYGFIKHIGVCAVPTFVMISGCLILDPKKEITHKKIINKYCKRIILVLLLFALPMCLAESFIIHQSLWTGLYDFVRGHSWFHMWYMYMLVCLYLLTPFIRTFIAHSSKKQIEYMLGVLFLVSILIPSLKTYGIQLESYINLGTPFIFYYILGYYLAHVETFTIKYTHCLIMVLCYLLIIATLEIGGFHFTENILKYSDLIPVLGSCSIFLLFKRININWDIANNLRQYCFAIYLVHTVFTNVAYKFLNIMPSSIAPPWLSLPLFSIIFFMLSLTLAYILRQVKFLREHVI